MKPVFQEILWRNFAAEIDMLSNIITICPEAFWQNDRQVFYMVYHTVIFLDYYLTVPVKDFHPQLPYTIVDPGHLPPGAIDDVLPDQRYSKDQLLGYIAAIREKCRRIIVDTPADKFSGRWIRTEEINMHGLCPALVVEYNLLEILLYNFRHVQHHVGQLNLLLRQKANVAADWISQSR